jgi:hypothetical protein
MPRIGSPLSNFTAGARAAVHRSTEAGRAGQDDPLGLHPRERRAAWWKGAISE